MEKPTSNKMILSRKYSGVYSKLLPNNQVMMYIAYKNSNGNYSKYKVGIKSSTITEQFCANLRANELAKIRLGSELQLATKSIIKFDEIAQDYYYNMELNQCSDTRNSKNKYENHIKPVFGGININDITPQMINEFKVAKLQTHANATVAMHIGFISSIYNHARHKTKKFKNDNPARSIESSIVINNHRKNFLSEFQVHHLLHALRSNQFNNKPFTAKLIYIFSVLALSTGARSSAIINIKRSHIDLNKKTVDIYDTKNKSWYKGYLSTKLFKQEDFEFLGAFKQHHYIFWNYNRQLTHRIIAYSLRPIFHELFNKDIKKAFDDGKISAQEYRNSKFSVHNYRHTFCSNLAMKGYSELMIAQLSNHKDLSQVRRYSKLSSIIVEDIAQSLY